MSTTTTTTTPEKPKKRARSTTKLEKEPKKKNKFIPVLANGKPDKEACWRDSISVLGDDIAETIFEYYGCLKNVSEDHLNKIMIVRKGTMLEIVSNKKVCKEIICAGTCGLSKTGQLRAYGHSKDANGRNGRTYVFEYSFITMEWHVYIGDYGDGEPFKDHLFCLGYIRKSQTDALQT